jgi:hypothetical protein
MTGGSADSTGSGALGCVEATVISGGGAKAASFIGELLATESEPSAASTSPRWLASSSSWAFDAIAVRSWSAAWIPATSTCDAL